MQFFPQNMTMVPNAPMMMPNAPMRANAPMPTMQQQQYDPQQHQLQFDPQQHQFQQKQLLFYGPGDIGRPII